MLSAAARFCAQQWRERRPADKDDSVDTGRIEAMAFDQHARDVDRLCDVICNQCLELSPADGDNTVDRWTFTICNPPVEDHVNAVRSREPNLFFLSLFLEQAAITKQFRVVPSRRSASLAGETLDQEVAKGLSESRPPR